MPLPKTTVSFRGLNLGDEKILKNLKKSIIELNESSAKENAEKLVETDLGSGEIIETISEALKEVRYRYESGEYFLVELMVAAEMMTEVADIN